MERGAILERKYNITAPTGLLGSAAMGGLPQKPSMAQIPRHGVAMCKDLC